MNTFCLGAPFLLFVVAFVASLSYFWERLETWSRTTGAWGSDITPYVVEDDAYRSATLQERTPNAAPAGVVRMVLACFSVACINLSTGLVSIAMELSERQPAWTHLLFYFAVSVAGIALFRVSRRFLGHERIPGGLIALVLCLQSAASALTTMKAISDGGGRLILAAVFYGVSWFVVLAMWLSPFRAQSERS